MSACACSVRYLKSCLLIEFHDVENDRGEDVEALTVSNAPVPARVGGKDAFECGTISLSGDGGTGTGTVEVLLNLPSQALLSLGGVGTARRKKGLHEARPVDVLRVELVSSEEEPDTPAKLLRDALRQSRQRSHCLPPLAERLFCLRD